MGISNERTSWSGSLIEQRKLNAPLGKILVNLGFVTEATVRDTLSETLGQVSIDLTNTIVDPAALALIPKEAARRYHVLPVALDREKKKLVDYRKVKIDAASHTVSVGKGMRIDLGGIAKARIAVTAG